MTIALDFNVLDQFTAQSYLSMLWSIFIQGGWVIFLIFFLWAGWKVYVKHIQKKYKAKQTYILIAIDVPKNNEQSPLAVENIFSHLAGAHATSNWAEKYVDGKTQEGFSLEIVSLEGYTQFLIYTNVKFRDLLEAAVYAQYPDAEMHEVADYTAPFAKLQFPNEEYDLYGTEYYLTKPECYPLRTYPEFEHALSQELKDPMAAFLENFSRLGKGEYLWFQIVITPVGQEAWKKVGQAVVNKLIGAKIEKKRTWADKVADAPVTALSWAGDILLPGTPLEDKKKAKEVKEHPSMMMYMSPGEKKLVEMIEEKMSKIGFKTKIRAIYLGKKEAFFKPRGPNALIGALKQFNTVNANSLRPELKTVGVHAHYVFVERRKNWKKWKILRAYVARSNWKGVGPRKGNWGKWSEHATGAGYILNIEELATLYHFPVMTVKAPAVKKTESKRAEPPAGLPMESEQIEVNKAFAAAKKAAAPDELPFSDEEEQNNF